MSTHNRPERVAQMVQELLGQIFVGHDEDVDVESFRFPPDLDLDPRARAGPRQSLEERAVLVPVCVEHEEAGVL